MESSKMDTIQVYTEPSAPPSLPPSSPPTELLPPPYTKLGDVISTNTLNESSSDDTQLSYISHVFNDKFKLSLWTQTMMYTLIEKQIVFVLDDSGSMATPVDVPQEEGSRIRITRWRELEGSVIDAFSLIIGLCSNGVDMHFLNRKPILSVKNIEQIKQAFRIPPSGSTPLFATLKKIKNLYNSNQVSITVWTDGEPDPDDKKMACEVFNLYYPNKKCEDYGICIVLCTDDDKVVDLYSFYDELYPLEVYDDYHSQMTAINKIQNKHKVKIPINRGMYFALLFLAPWCQDLDSINEKSLSVKQFNLIAKKFIDKIDPECKYPRTFDTTQKKSKFNLFKLFCCI
jgi:hypothetical protein